MSRPWLDGRLWLDNLSRLLDGSVRPITGERGSGSDVVACPVVMGPKNDGR